MHPAGRARMNGDLTMVSRCYEISVVGHLAPARMMTPA
ncbi:MAG: hypothetical protein OJF48_000523 [Afipia sp.]|nr:MAG: hypothetical protein OJF48_000523 [Afipia sp.]